jgi:hypothetical protein
VNKKAAYVTHIRAMQRKNKKELEGFDPEEEDVETGTEYGEGDLA